MMAKFLLFFLAALHTAVACTNTEGVLFSHVGDWTFQGADIKALSADKCVSLGNFNTATQVWDLATLKTSTTPPSRSSTVVVLLESGLKYRKVCEPGKVCTSGPIPGTASVETASIFRAADLYSRLTASIAGVRQLVPLSSRSDDWTDAVVSFSQTKSTSLDVSAVLSRTPAGVIEDIRLCPISSAGACAERSQAIEWDGKVGLLEARGIAPGVYRMVEGNVTSEAWVRVVAAPDLEAVRSAYATGRQRLQALPNSDLPEAFASEPGRKALLRALLAAAGKE